MATLNIVLQKLAAFRFVQGKTRLLFTKYLLLTNTVITVSLSGTGDALQQYYEKVQKRQKHWNPVRTRHVCWTGAVIGPMCHFWYRYLEEILPGRTIMPVVKKLFLDQVVFTPVYISVFLVMLGCFERATFGEMMHDLQHKGVVLLKADWIIWPPAQMVNFCLLPVQYRVLYDNTISLGFDCYYSHVKYRTDHDSELDRDVVHWSNTHMDGEDEEEYDEDEHLHRTVHLREFFSI